MYRVTTANGRVGHIAGGIYDGAEGRTVTTVCGKSYPEYELHVDDSLDACSACDKKFFNQIDDVTEIVAPEEEVKVVEKAPVEEEKPTTKDTSTKK